MSMDGTANIDLERMVRLGSLSLPPGFLGELRAELGAQTHHAAAPGLVYQRTLSRGRRRQNGVYYTPAPIVRYVSEATLLPLLRGKGVDEVLDLRVADLACGGGVFAVIAMAVMEQHCTREDPRGVAALGGQVALRRELVRRCLLAVDVDPQAADVARLALSLYIDPAGSGADVLGAAVRVADSLTGELGNLPLAAVVGNPPWGQKDFEIDAPTRAALRQRFECARGPLDPFKLFVERAHQLLSPGGRWGLVLPDVLLLKDQEPIRRLILRGSEIESIVTLGRAFPEVNLDAVAVVGERVAEPRPEHRVSIWYRLPDDSEAGAPHSQAQAVFGELPGAKFNLYLSDASLALYRKLGAFPRLGSRFEIHEGVHSGNCRHKLFRSEEPRGPRAPLVVGKGELRPFQLRWSGRWLDLDPDCIDRHSGEYANLGRPEWHLRPKLVVRRTGDRIVAAHDRHGYYVSNNLFVLVPGDADAEADLAAYLGLLGSSLYTWYFRTEQPRIGRLFSELKICHLRSFPVPAPESWAEARGELSLLADALERGPRPELQARLDEVVATLFDLDDGAREQVAMVTAERRSR